ncbi:serine/threonine-protein phosphatase 7 long form-like protein [Gossypium australe]|uniref:Serine/threonine-protein phosphatase 7 long form-like protein n=1 Tax=Gossypium australe TaxID=47621 RepID=A0A5B6X1K7_9ROSI|nr:serine/threonine-protein phosphatase 7 long form-like protein [Gossypium australe]
MLEGCKLDPKLINALVERWRLETRKFYLPCGECTITLEDVALQLGLLVDGPAVMGPVIIPSKEDLCEAFLG